MRKIGDVSRRRRLFGCPAQVEWYARWRSVRFARRYSLTACGMDHCSGGRGSRTDRHADMNVARTAA